VVGRENEVRVSRRSLLGAAGVAVAAPALALSTTRRSTDAELDAALRAILPQTGDPGLAVVAVRASRVVHLGGYGFRDVERRLPVTPDTRFQLGSLTKGMTAILTLALADEGLVRVDQPARLLVPELVMPPESGPIAPTIADLLSHRTGMPAHNLVWYGAEGLGADDLARRVRHLQAIVPVGGGFRYNNLMYAVAGLAIERAGGDSWASLLRRKLAAPLGLRSVAVVTVGTGNVARPYYITQGRPRLMQPRSLGAVSPAGGVAASMRDMAAYLRMLMARGQWDGRRILSEESIAALWTPIVQRDAPQREKWADPIAHYGLGFNVDRYHAVRRVHHTGSIDGYHTRLILFPDDDLAVLAASNSGTSRAPEIAGNIVADRLLGLPPTDWVAQYAAPAQNSAPPQRYLSNDAAAQLPGRYDHPAYGALVIVAGSDGLVRLRLHGLTMRLRVTADGAWLTAPELPDLPVPGLDAPVRVQADGAVTIGFEPKIDPIRFAPA
jgi:CubicO group peptidase (beta-lactamase class C family)